MIVLLHGDDMLQSREELHALKAKEKEKGKEIKTLDAKTINDDASIQILSSHSLFGDRPVVIIENLFSSSGKKTARIQGIIERIQEYGAETDIILWEEKEIGKSIIQLLGSKAIIKPYKLPTVVFTFLDSIRPKNARHTLSLYDALLKEKPPEFIYVMLYKRFKQLVLLRSGFSVNGLRPWQITRLTNQARQFTLEQLLSLYRHIRMLEYKRNSGQAEFDLKEAIEFMLCTI
ncbi:MAG: hypothetical protein N3A54_00360 [Patescibacteria group bacterium]|nr:hypothetical protein [Patescibacteria group bacterium]